MKPRLFLSVILASSLILHLSQAQEEAAKPAKETKSKKPTQEEMEAKFIATMTNATMSGRWCLIKDGKLTPEKEDKYTIVSVKKNENNSWIINSRIEYGGFNMVVPVPVKMAWADDTPVIVVNNMGIPGGNKYSARVLVFEDSYAGTWSGPGLQGLLNGMITRTPVEEDKDEKKEDPKEEASKETEAK